MKLGCEEEEKFPKPRNSEYMSEVPVEKVVPTQKEEEQEDQEVEEEEGGQ